MSLPVSWRISSAQGQSGGAPSPCHAAAHAVRMPAARARFDRDPRESSLADARLAGDEDHLAESAGDACDRLVDRAELRRATDQVMLDALARASSRCTIRKVESVSVALREGGLEVVRLPGDESVAPLVFLHEGLGSIGLWRQFPAEVAAATGRVAVVYSRLGYGHSDPWPGKKGPDYMHREALESLPALLDALAVTDPVLIGHSDGASIALIYAGMAGRPVTGLVLLAPHVFVEPESIVGIADAREAYLTTDLSERMARHHDEPDATFWQWNDVWLSPEFRDWNIEDVLPAIEAPVLVVQGTSDQYGTVAQVEAIERGVTGHVEALVLDGCGHAPHLECGAVTLDAVTHFVRSLADRSDDERGSA